MGLDPGTGDEDGSKGGHVTAAVRQLPSEDLVGVDLQPLAHLRAPLDELAERLGFSHERDHDDLGPLSVTALAVDGARYLLRSFDHAPVPMTELHCADTGDPVSQLDKLLAIADLRHLVTHWWDGKAWHDEPLDPAPDDRLGNYITDPGQRPGRARRRPSSTAPRRDRAGR